MDAFLLDNLWATKLNTNEITSEKLCKASEINAKLPDIIPPISWANVMIKFKTIEIIKFVAFYFVFMYMNVTHCYLQAIF